jgi:hypothetical protein
MAKKKPVGKKKKTTTTVLRPAVTSFLPVFTATQPVTIRIYGANFKGTLNVVLTEVTNNDFKWDPTPIPITPDDSGTLTVPNVAPKTALSGFSGAGDGDLTITVTTTDATKQVGETTMKVSYTTP